MLNIRTKILVCGYLVQGADFWGSYVLILGAIRKGRPLNIWNFMVHVLTPHQF